MDVANHNGRMWILSILTLNLILVMNQFQHKIVSV